MTKENDPVENKKLSECEFIVDCKKFKTELRMGLLNNSKLKVKVKDNEVIKIT
jgi:hypothetical protein